MPPYILGTSLKATTTSSATTNANEIASDLNPPIPCKNDSDCQHIAGTECKKDQGRCGCRKYFPATDGRKCYKGMKMLYFFT